MSDNDSGSVFSDFRSVVSNESDFDEDSDDNAGKYEEWRRRLSYQSQDEEMFWKVPTTVIGGDTRGEDMAEIFEKHRPTHFYTDNTDTQNDSIWQCRPVDCAMGTSGAVNVVLGILALSPSLVSSMSQTPKERCIPDFNRWLVFFGVVAILCPSLYSIFQKFNTHGPLVGRNGPRRPIWQWILLFAGPCVLVLNWMFNLGWAVLGIRVFMRNRVFGDETLSSWCQHEHDIGLGIVVAILGSLTIVAFGTCVFSLRFLEILVRNWYRRRAVSSRA